jgi:hypothetical protein
MAVQEGRQDLPRDASDPGDGDGRMKLAEVRLQAGMKIGILDVLVQGKQLRMSLTDSGPNHGQVGSAKGAQPSDRQEERRDLDSLECLTQSLLVPGLDIAEESQGEVDLLRGEPSYPFQPWIESGQGLPAVQAR